MTANTSTGNGPESKKVQSANHLGPDEDKTAQTLKAARRAVVRAQIQYARTRRTKDALKLQESGLLEEELDLTKKAKVLALESEQKALDCLAYSVRCRVRLTRVREHLQAQEALEFAQLAHLQDCERKLEKQVELADASNKQKTVMRALAAMACASAAGLDMNGEAKAADKNPSKP